MVGLAVDDNDDGAVVVAESLLPLLESCVVIGNLKLDVSLIDNEDDIRPCLLFGGANNVSNDFMPINCGSGAELKAAMGMAISWAIMSSNALDEDIDLRCQLKT